MKRILPTAAVVALPAILVAAAFAAQDRYTLRCRAASRSPSSRDTRIGRSSLSVTTAIRSHVIVGNPAMIEAYKAGIPGNGKPFPDGARMAKIHWVAKKAEDQPGPADGARPAARRRLHGEGQQTVCG